MRWEPWLPSKINVFIWRLELDRIPTRVALVNRGINILDTRCPFCEFAHESAFHLIVDCDFVKVRDWCRIQGFCFDSVTELLKMDCIANKPKWEKKLLRGLVLLIRICKSFGGNYNMLIVYSATNSKRWLEFTVKKKVHIIDMDFVEDQGHGYMCSPFKYNFPLRLSRIKTRHLFKWPSSNATVVEMVSLKQLFSKNVNVTEKIFQELLANSTYLGTISIHGSGHLINIRVSGQAINVKHLEIHRCAYLKSIHLSDFDLVSFDHMGRGVDLNVANFPNLGKLFCQELMGPEYNILNEISSGALSL